MSANDQRIFMQLLRFKAEPKSDSLEFNKYGGATVNCWIKDRTKQDAREAASLMIENSGWIPLRLEEQLEADSPKERAAGKEYFDQALIDGEVIVFYTYPRATE